MPLKRLRKTFSDRLDKRIATYILTTSAGLALGSARSAEAAVVYASVKKFGEPQQAYRPVSAPIDLNHDGQVDFTLVDSFGSAYDSIGPFRSASLRCSAGQGNQIADVTSTFEGAKIAQALELGQEVGPNLKFAGAGAILGKFFSVGFGAQSGLGQFYNQRNKFLALKLVVGSETYYGWARVSTHSHLSTQPVGDKLAFELVDYAYQSTPNLPILAGQGIPKPETAGLLDFTGEAVVGSSDKSQRGPALGLLAHGSDALPLWRK